MEPHINITADNVESDLWNATIIEAYIHWSSSVTADANANATGNVEFLVTIEPSIPEYHDHSHAFLTTNKSMQLNVLYDQQYNITVIASNCVGKSTPGNIIIGESLV